MTNFDKQITNPEIEEYIRSLYGNKDQILSDMEELARERGFPIIGPLVGRLFYQLAHMINAKNVFELGSGFGYSAYWFSRAIAPNGMVFLNELSAHNIELAKGFFSRTELCNNVEFSVGDAVGQLAKSPGGLDIVFNDINKEDYPKTIPLAQEKLRKGGLFITDNVLWGGRVLSDDGAESTKGVKEFTRELLAHKGFFTTVIPIRDGIAISTKI